MSVKLSEFIKPLRNIIKQFIEKNFDSLLKKNLIDRSKIDLFAEVFDRYPFEVIEPPEKEYFRALGQSVSSLIRDKIEEDMLPLEEDYEDFSCDQINSVLLKEGEYKFDIDILVEPDPKAKKTTLYLCLVLEAIVSGKDYFFSLRYLYLS